MATARTLEDLEALPDALQNDFVAQLHGAAAAVRVLAGDQAKEAKADDSSSG